MKEEIEIQLISSNDDYKINQICEILNQNEIPFIKKEDGSGSYMNLYMGKSIQEKRIFVSEDDYDRAIDLIESFESNSEGNIEDEEIPSKSKNIIRGVGLIILALPIIVVIILIVMSIIGY